MAITQTATAVVPTARGRIRRHDPQGFPATKTIAPARTVDAPAATTNACRIRRAFTAPAPSETSQANDSAIEPRGSDDTCEHRDRNARKSKHLVKTQLDSARASTALTKRLMAAPADQAGQPHAIPSNRRLSPNPIDSCDTVRSRSCRIGARGEPRTAGIALPHDGRKPANRQGPSPSATMRAKLDGAPAKHVPLVGQCSAN